MSRVAELLARKRAAQIQRMQGEDVSTVEVDAQLAAVKIAKPKRCKVEGKGLHFSKHAKQRMSQRGMGASAVYAIWRMGESSSSHGSIVHHVTDSAIANCPASMRAELQRWKGAAIVVRAPDESKHDPVLITVLADGEDTHFHKDKKWTKPRRFDK